MIAIFAAWLALDALIVGWLVIASWWRRRRARRARFVDVIRADFTEARRG